MGKRVSYVSDARGTTTKLNGISDLLALFPLSTALGRAVNHKAAGVVAYGTNVRAPAKPSSTRFGRSGDLSAAGLTALMRTEKRRTYRARCAMVRSITHHACSPFRFCRWCLLITTCKHHLRLLQAPRHQRHANTVKFLSVPVCVLTRGALHEVGECLAVCWGSWRKALSYSHNAPQAERSTLQSVAVKRVRASVSRLPFPGLQRDPPRRSLSFFLSLARLAPLASSQCEAAGHRPCDS